jgi:hypothetical protein
MNPPIRERVGRENIPAQTRRFIDECKSKLRFTVVSTSRVWDFLSRALDGWGSLAIRVRVLRFLVFPLGRSTYPSKLGFHCDGVELPSRCPFAIAGVWTGVYIGCFLWEDTEKPPLFTLFISVKEGIRASYTAKY